MKIAIVTGGGTGIGRSISLGLAQDGYRVGLVGRREAPLRNAAQTITSNGGHAWHAALDVRQESAVNEFVAETIGRFGRIDLLVNNAGLFRLVEFADTDLTFWQETLETNLTGAYIFCKAVWPHIGGGQIINIGSTAGEHAFRGCAAYSASKFGLRGLTEVLALEGQQRKIRVHLVSPGNTDTPIWDGQAPDSARQRMMRPDDVADMVRFVANSPPHIALDTIVIRPAQSPWNDE